MNVQEHLLVCLAEECAEVQHAITKILRFGLADTKPGTNRTNQYRLHEELCDLITIVKMLKDSQVVTGHIVPSREKEDKVLDHIIIARRTGTIQ